MSNIIRREVTISAKSSLSTAVNVKDGVLVGIVLDENFSTGMMGSLSIWVAPRDGGTYYKAYDASGTEIKVKGVKKKGYHSLAHYALQGVQHIKFESSAAQKQDVTITVVVRQE